jgi:hypothetical protein
MIPAIPDSDIRSRSIGQERKGGVSQDAARLAGDVILRSQQATKNRQLLDNPSTGSSLLPKMTEWNEDSEMVSMDTAPIGRGPYWEGDLTLSEPESITFGRRVFLESPFMSTAIASQYTDEGFAIAADSLRKHSLTGKDISTRVQKIFPIEEKQNKRVLAYALAGAVNIANPDGLSIFNFAQEFSAAVPRLTGTQIHGLDNYCKQLAELVNERLLIVRENGCLSEYPSIPNYPGVIARVVFVGYYSDLGCLAQIEFRHDNQTLLPPILTKLAVGPPSFEIFSGSAFISKMIFESKGLGFSRYRTRSVKKGIPPNTLLEAKELVRNYIQACIDNHTRDKECESIGGQPQVATVSPKRGFEWFIKPLGPDPLADLKPSSSVPDS